MDLNHNSNISGKFERFTTILGNRMLNKEQVEIFCYIRFKCRVLYIFAYIGLEG